MSSITLPFLSLGAFRGNFSKNYILASTIEIIIKLKNVFPSIKQLHFVDVEQLNVQLFNEIIHWKKFDKKIEYVFDKIKLLRRRSTKNRYSKVEKMISKPQISTEVTQKVVQKPTSSAEIWKSFSQPSTSTSPLFKNDFDSSSDDEESIPTITSSPSVTRNKHQTFIKTEKQPQTCILEDPTGINRSVRSEFTSSNKPPISPRHENEIKPSNLLVPTIDQTLPTSIEHQHYEMQQPSSTVSNEPSINHE